jgi:serine O-acetyltransferase
MVNQLWQDILAEVRLLAEREPVMASFFHATVLKHSDLGSALSFQLAAKLDTTVVPAMLIREVCEEAYADDDAILAAAVEDLKAVRERDPACDMYAIPLLYFKGFMALQSHRVAHWLWRQGRQALALYFQNRNSQVFDVDIHPAAKIGSGIMFDHATGIVIGETSVIGNNVSILHSVTLGGSGSNKHTRHPQIADGVLISTGAKILGNITVGEGAKIAAGSVVLQPVPAHTTVAGVPAKVVGRPRSDHPSLEMNQQIN